MPPPDVANAKNHPGQDAQKWLRKRCPKGTHSAPLAAGTHAAHTGSNSSPPRGAGLKSAGNSSIQPSLQGQNAKSDVAQRPSLQTVSVGPHPIQPLLSSSSAPIHGTFPYHITAFVRRKIPPGQHSRAHGLKSSLSPSGTCVFVGEIQICPLASANRRPNVVSDPHPQPICHAQS